VEALGYARRRAPGPPGTTTHSIDCEVFAAPMPILTVDQISVRFGGIVALDDVSFDIEPRQIVGLIGPNGAGKTTCFNCVSRLYEPTAGGISFEGRDLLRARPHEISGLGIGRTFQNVALFMSMTVLGNVMVGAHSQTRSGLLANALRLPIVGREERAQQEIAEEIIHFLGLEAVAHVPVAGLPFATQKRVEMARALASHPKLLMLDEPAGGLNHEEVAALSALIRLIRDQRGITVLLVEHHMGLVMDVSEKVVVLDFGRKIAQGSPAEVQRNADVVKAYLGA
jgi:branched-chain amino acid transport system ATP-binding protein